MTTEPSLFHSDPEDIFAKAIERVEAGESIEAVLATAPGEMRAELHELLLLITATHHLQRAPVPQPSAPRRTARKDAFLQAAAQMKAEATVEIAAASARPKQTTPALARTAQPQQRLAEWLHKLWHDLQAAFASPNLRLAPLLVIIAAVWVGSFGFVTAAQAAGMGDLVYPIKQWIDYQELSLSSEQARGKVYKRIVERIIDDVNKATAELTVAERATGRRVAVGSTERLVFEKIENNQLVFGDIQVMMQYQPDPNVNEYISMVMLGTPGAGDQVDLTFQVIPSEDGNDEQGFIIQGILLTIPTVQLTIGPTPTPEPTALPILTTTPTATSCAVTMRSGWAPYIVRMGDSLSAIAQQTGATVAELQQVNCLADANAITVGQRLLAPAIQQGSTPTAVQPPLAATLTAISTTVLTPSVDITLTVTVVPTGTVNVTPTAITTATVTPEAITTITATVTQTATVTPDTTVTVTATVTPTPPMTVTTTSEAIDNGTVTATETVTDAIAPASATPTAPTVSASSTAAPASTADSTPTATDDAEVGPTASPTQSVERAGLPTSTVTPVPTHEATDKGPIEAGEASPTRETERSGTNGTQAGLPTSTSTPVPQNRSPLSRG